jgi:hypothetical protein
MQCIGSEVGGNIQSISVYSHNDLTSRDIGASVTVQPLEKTVCYQPFKDNLKSDVSLHELFPLDHARQVPRSKEITQKSFEASIFISAACAVFTNLHRILPLNNQSLKFTIVPIKATLISHN